MNLREAREAIENNIIVFFVTTLATGFGVGLAVHSVIQSATGQTSISMDRLKQLEQPVDRHTLRTRVEELETERADLMQRLASNRPTTGNYVHNVGFNPTSPSVIAIDSTITVRFNYVLANDERAHIWVSGDGPTLGYGSELLSGTGTAERLLTAKRAGRMKEVTIRMKNVDGEALYEMKLPVDFTFK